MIRLRPWHPEEASAYHDMRDDVIFSWTTEEALGLAAVRASISDDPTLRAIEEDSVPVGALRLTAGPCPEISFWLRASARGRGLGGEAVRIALADAFAGDGVRFVEARVHPDNAASAALLAGLGFRHAGTTSAPRACSISEVDLFRRHRIDAWIFDLGGVVLDSPLEVMRAVEVESGLPAGSIGAVVQAGGDSSPWAMLERGDISRSRFCETFGSVLADRDLVVDVADLLHRMETSITVRHRVVELIRTLRRRNFRVAALTNNWEPFDQNGLAAEFDVFVESIREGVRKPEPEIYRRCLDRLGVDARHVAMVDDLGPNLKSARELGMLTVKAMSESQVLDSVARISLVPPQG
ncbi:MAG: HAD-IA family hydrolase [Acidimicrobiia bacterium]|nr:HAD-IA family hydrolase [Acidimicrobiia bacterium]